ncbi:MAG: hypothetical protein AAF430_25770 [Myxococcota bacterium]
MAPRTPRDTRLRAAEPTRAAPGEGWTRRAFLGASLATGAGLLACFDAPPFVDPSGWDAGPVEHLLPAVGPTRIRLKASFATPLAEVQLRAGRRSVAGRREDSAGRFFSFDLDGLEPDTEVQLELMDGVGKALCASWPLRTFPAPDAEPKRFRLLAYSCAGGFDAFFHPIAGRIFLETSLRQRLLARALSFAPDAAIANGDHVYWDLQSRPGLAMGRSPQAWWLAGSFDRSQPILGTPNEAVLQAAFGPQLAGLYGTLFRSVPVFFLQDDHDYTENDEADEDLRTFPADTFMRRVARATQALYYPEFLEGPPGYGPDGVFTSFGRVRYGRLFEGLCYDCRAELTNAADPLTGHEWSGFVSPEVEDWLRRRTRVSDARFVAHLPSTPILWTAGKWGEWYPDGKDDVGGLQTHGHKPFWAPGWLEQHDRLLAVHSARGTRPLWLSGDLHATGMGEIRMSGPLYLRDNPVTSVLVGTPGAAGPGWPSRVRGQRPVPSGTLTVDEWVPPIEENGFSLIDFEADQVTISQFRWRPEQGADAIDTLTPFAVRTLSRRPG